MSLCIAREKKLAKHANCLEREPGHEHNAQPQEQYRIHGISGFGQKCECESQGGNPLLEDNAGETGEKGSEAGTHSPEPSSCA